MTQKCQQSSPLPAASLESEFQSLMVRVKRNRGLDTAFCGDEVKLFSDSGYGVGGGGGTIIWS